MVKPVYNQEDVDPMEAYNLPSKKKAERLSRIVNALEEVEDTVVMDRVHFFIDIQKQLEGILGNEYATMRATIQRLKRPNKFRNVATSETAEEFADSPEHSAFSPSQNVTLYLIYQRFGSEASISAVEYIGKLPKQNENNNGLVREIVTALFEAHKKEAFYAKKREFRDKGVEYETDGWNIQPKQEESSFSERRGFVLDELVDEERMQQFASQVSALPEEAKEKILRSINPGQIVDFYEGYLSSVTASYALRQQFGEKAQPYIRSFIGYIATELVKFDHDEGDLVTFAKTEEDCVNPAIIRLYAEQAKKFQASLVGSIRESAEGERAKEFYEGLLEGYVLDESLYLNTDDPKNSETLLGSVVAVVADEILKSKEGKIALVPAPTLQ